MKTSLRICLLAIFLLALSSAGRGQTPAQPQSSPPAKAPAADKSRDSARAREEAKRLEEQRRVTATALLVSLADEARSYRNQTLRARVQARAADILWETDALRARTLFRRAWEAAEIADAETERRFQEERRAEEQAGRPFAATLPQSLRTEVLRMAAKRERALGEEFLAKLDEARKQEAAAAGTEQTSSPESGDPFELPAAFRLRLRLARQLLDTDVERAIEFADPALARVSIDGLTFLTYLREKNPLAADERYAAMLMRAGASEGSDANTVSLLSSYLFTPFVFVRIMPDGGMNTSQFDESRAAPSVAPELRAAFFRVAEQVFLRPLPPPEQDRTTSGRTGKYLIMTRLLPLFEQHAAEQSVNLLKAQLTALSREVPEGHRRGADKSLAQGLDADEPDKETIQAVLDRIERAVTAEERDRLYTQAALLAIEEGDKRAFEFADKIEETELRRSVRAYVDFNMTRYALEKKRFEEAVALARKGALASMQRVWALTQLARAFIKTDRETASGLLDEAGAEAKRIGGSSADRPRALVAIATVTFELDRQRGWDAVLEAVRAANNTAEDFSGEDARLTAALRAKTHTSMQTFTAPDFDLPGLFRQLGRDDLERAIELAKDFNGEAPRATSLIAIIRATLEKKPATETGQQKAR